MWRRRVYFVVVLAFLGLALTPSFGQSTQGQQDFDALKAQALEQEQNPAVARYRTQIAPRLDTLLDQVLLRCVRRELYSRRAESSFVLTIESDGQVSSVLLKTENRMGACSARALEGIVLPPPPEAPLQLLVGSHFQKF